MSRKVVYGVISDVHSRTENLEEAIFIFERQKVDKIIVNGDLGNTSEEIYKNVKILSETNIETYIQPGGHERFMDYYDVLNYGFPRKSNLVDIINYHSNRIENSDHALVFLPGSIWNAKDGGFLLGKRNIETGEYILVPYINKDQYARLIQNQEAKGIIKYNVLGPSNELKKGRYIAVPFREEEQFLILKEKENAKSIIYYQNINDLEKLVKDPETDIIISHVPRKFNSLNFCVDVAQYAETRDKKIVSRSYAEADAINYILKNTDNFNPNEKDIKKTVTEILGYTFKEDNRGSQEMKEIFEKLGIKKAINGHFHESAHRANDLKENHVPENEWIDELYWNASAVVRGRIGILEVLSNEVMYKNLHF